MVDDQLFRGPRTFLGAPFSEDYSDARVAFLGIPFDCGSDPDRIGARFGPEALRMQSGMLSPIDPLTGRDAVADLGLIDAGDVAVVPGDIDHSFPRIEAAVAAILDAGAIPMSVGGDGAVTLPQLRALARIHQDLVVLHIDAHTDAYPIEGINTATTFSRAAEEGLLDTSRSFHIGARGGTSAPGVYAHAESLGYRLIPMSELTRRGFDAVAGEVKDTIGRQPTHLCWDLDFYDATAVPGVCDPTFGGASAREGLDFLRAFAGLNFVSFDINTLTPPHDVGGMTALLAATTALECLFNLV